MRSGRLYSALCAFVLLAAAGCCGVAADPTTAPSSTATVDSEGTVHFEAIAVGTLELFAVPIKETAATSETIVSASLTGSGATSFEIQSPFPIAVPNGQDATIDVLFIPTAPGAVHAQLMLQTAKMGTSQIPLVGSAF